MSLSEILLYCLRAAAFAAAVCGLYTLLCLVRKRPLRIIRLLALAYLAANAGLEVLDVIQTDAEASPSPARMLELTRRIREHRPALILTEPQFPDRLAQTLAQETQVPLLSLDPLASGPADAPLSYYEAVMAANCNLLERSLVQP